MHAKICFAVVLANLHDYDDETTLSNNDYYNEEEEEELADEEAKEKETTNENDLRRLSKQASNIVKTTTNNIVKTFQQKQQERQLRQERHRLRQTQIATELLQGFSKHLYIDKKEDFVKSSLLPLLSSKTTPTTPTATTATLKPSLSALSDLSLDSYWRLEEDELLISGSSLLQHTLTQLSRNAGYKCLVLVLFQHLLSCKDGYDARVRYALKRLAVLLFVHNNKNRNNNDSDDDDDDDTDYDTRVLQATRKYEWLEHELAQRIIILAANQQQEASQQENSDEKSKKKEQLIRGLKIGTAGVVAGTLLVVTGGMAAPGIAAGLGALGLSAVGATFLTLATSTAVVSIFGVAGGSLAMYKMNRRTAGLTEFSFVPSKQPEQKDSKTNKNNELSRTICLSGWLRDEHDFQRPWGMTPSQPPLPKYSLEALQRLYKVYNPKLIPYASDILELWHGKEFMLWKQLKETYGVDPDHLFPLLPRDHEGRPTVKESAKLTSKELDRLDRLIVHVGKLHDKNDTKTSNSKQAPSSSSDPTHPQPFAKMGNDFKKAGGKLGWGKKKSNDDKGRTSFSAASSARTGMSKMTKQGGKFLSGLGKKNKESFSSFTRPSGRSSLVPTRNDAPETVGLNIDIGDNDNANVIANEDASKEKNDEHTIPKNMSTVWDYHAAYGGELYTVKWESSLVLALSNSVGEQLAYELGTMAGKTVASTTVASALLVAATLPTAVISAMNAIDGNWTLMVERADVAGRELAKSLLSNRAGRRPVTLIGYSFGARAIYSCLNELSKYQDEWEEKRRQTPKESPTKNGEFDEGVGVERRNKDSPTDIELDCEPACVVEDVVLMGTPRHLDHPTWQKCRQIVAGRLVNVYSRKDKILSYMFRYKRLTGGLKPVCGTCTVAVPGVENIDATDLVSGHADYCLVIGDILKRIKLGQPLRFSSAAVDEAALIAEVEHMAMEEKEAEK